jgi:hypothetical protein
MEIPYSFYLYLLKNIDETFRVDGVRKPFTFDECSNYICKWNIPKPFRYIVIKELIILEYLIEKDGLIFVNPKKVKRAYSINSMYLKVNGTKFSDKPVRIGYKWKAKWV